MIKHEPISISQFAELLGIEPAQLRSVEVDRLINRVVVAWDTEDRAVSQTSGVIPQLNTGGKKIGGKRPKGKK